MLVISRKNGQKIMINDNIEITIVEAKNGVCKVAIKADKDVKIYREEIYLQIKLENLIGKETRVNTVDSVATMLKDSNIKINDDIKTAKPSEEEVIVDEGKESKSIVIKKNNKDK